MDIKKSNKSNSIIFIIILLVILIIVTGAYFFITKSNKNTGNLSNDVTSNDEYNKNSKYSIKDKWFSLNNYDTSDEEFSGMKLLEYDNSNDKYAEIYYIFYDYFTDPSFYYTVEIKDKNKNTLLLKDKKEEKLMGGIASSVKIKKTDLNSVITFSIFEKERESGQILKNSRREVDLSKELQKIKKIDQTVDLKNGKLGDMSFKYIDSDDVYFGETAHAYSEKLVGENASFPLKSQYGNYLLLEDHIEFSYDKNVNELSLEDAFEKLSLINKTFGQYGLSDVYGMDILDKNGEILDTVIITFDEIIQLANGKTINKNRKEYTKKSFEDTLGKISMIKDENVQIGNEIDAIKYHYDNDDGCDYYMFTYKDNIYTLKVPESEKVSEEVQQFIDSLEGN